MKRNLPTPADTNAKRLREVAAEFERHGMAYLMAAAHVRAHADKEWPQ